MCDRYLNDKSAMVVSSLNCTFSKLSKTGTLRCYIILPTRRCHLPHNTRNNRLSNWEASFGLCLQLLTHWKPLLKNLFVKHCKSCLSILENALFGGNYRAVASLDCTFSKASKTGILRYDDYKDGVRHTTRPTERMNNLISLLEPVNWLPRSCD